jgi:two-component system response regulator HydG
MKISKKILVVDDLPDWRKTLNGLLSDRGYIVQDAYSIDSALKLLESNNFDLTVIDLRLNERNEKDEGGLELAAKIKRSWPKTKIILITGYGTSERIKRAMEPDLKTGQTLVDDYLPKTETEKLIDLVENILGHN